MISLDLHDQVGNESALIKGGLYSIIIVQNEDLCPHIGTSLVVLDSFRMAYNQPYATINLSKYTRTFHSKMAF